MVIFLNIVFKDFPSNFHCSVTYELIPWWPFTNVKADELILS